MEELRLGVDLGGTKIELIALGAKGEELLRRRISTPQGDYPSTLRTIQELVAEAEHELGQRGAIGIGAPGALSRVTGRIKNSNSACLNGQRLQQDLQTLLGRPVRLSNDANCFTLSEAIDGAAAGYSVVFGVIIGTGTGAGIAIEGKVLVGPNAIAGEWGHNPLPWPQAEELEGAGCYCGKQNCIETWLSGPGMMRDHREVNGEILDPKMIVLRASEGDAACEATLQRYEDRLARSLAHVINLLDPHIIVLGGGLSNIHRLYHNVPQRWRDYVFSDRVDTCLVPPRYGDSSGVRGAAWL